MKIVSYLGTTSFFVMASTRPEYNDKIQLANLLAPVAVMQNTTSPIGRTLAKLLVANERALSLAGQHEFLPGDDFAARIQQRFCSQSIATGVCKHFLFLIAGHNPELFNHVRFSISFQCRVIRKLTHFVFRPLSMIFSYMHLLDLVNVKLSIMDN